MLPHGVEVRPELQLTSGVLAFGFCGEGMGDRDAVSLLGADLLDHILKTAASAPAGLVVVDMRNAGSLSTAGTGQLLVLSRRLEQAGWKLVLLIDDPIIREVLAATHLDRQLFVAASEAELRDLVQRYPSASAQPQAQQEPEVDFSDNELAHMEAAGITLEDAIRVIEEMRR